MSKNAVRNIFITEIFDLYTETFENVQGKYLDRGTSLFETLKTITAAEASQPISTCASIAAQVEHIRFFVEVLGKVLRGEEVGKVNWNEIWETIGEVSVEEWEASKQRLHDAYTKIIADMKNLDTWEGENDIAAALEILVHTAYHLGEIRQALCTVQPPSLAIND